MLPMRLTELVEITFKNIYRRISKVESSCDGRYMCKISTCGIAGEKENSRIKALNIENFNGDVDVVQLKEDSRVKAALPFASGRSMLVGDSLICSDSGIVDDMLESAMQNVVDTHNFLSLDHGSSSAEEGEWRSLLSNSHELVEDMSIVLDECVFPNNKFTRRRPELRGGSLYLPGLIRALITNFQYKKIFGARTAGGKSVYNVCLVLDISSSMQGTLLECAIVSMAAMISGLVRLGIENFSLIAFGDTVNIVKTSELPWDSTAIAMLLKSIKPGRCASRDADAVEVAVELLARSSARGPKKVFVFTDGYGSTGNRLQEALKRASQQNVEVVGVAVGMERTRVSSAFNTFAEALVPSGLSHALRDLYGESGASLQGGNNKLKSDFDQCLLSWEEKKRSDGGGQDGVSTLRNIFLEGATVFESLREALKTERELKIVSSGTSSFTVSVAFVVDATGSMGSFISSVKSQIISLVQTIRNSVEKNEAFQGFQLKMLFRVLAYRDHCDGNLIYEDSGSFTEVVDDIVQFISNLVTGGGGDGAEEVVGALNKASQWTDWDKDSAAKFVVLVADAPGHGLSGGVSSDDFPKGHPSVPKPEEVIKELSSQSIEILFCRIKRNYTLTMEREFRNCFKKADCTFDMSSIDLFSQDSVEALKCHFIFVLDDSGSMGFCDDGCESRWTVLQRAYIHCLKQREMDQGNDDIVSVIQFSSNAQIMLQGRTIADARNSALHSRGGGTYYDTGLRECENIISNSVNTGSTTTPVVIFMSDGLDSSGHDVARIVQKMKADHSSKGFILHTVGFGRDAAGSTLGDMAVSGGGKYWAAKNASELTKAFQSITAGASVMDQLIEKFGEKVGEKVSNRIVMDYL